MLNSEERRVIERSLRFRERRIITDDEVVGKLNYIARPENLDEIIAEIPAELADPLREKARVHPGGYHRVCDPLPEALWPRLAAADRLTLYSLLHSRKEDATEEQGRFHEYPVLGRVVVSEPGLVAEVVSTLKAGADQGTRGYRCFDPHHGVRAEIGDARVDLVICFLCECMQLFESTSDEEHVWADISERPVALLDRLLREAGVPLAPRARR